MTTNKYANGKIYAIRSHKTDQIYVGSTVTKLSDRLYKHRSRHKNKNTSDPNGLSSHEIFKYGDAYIELLEACPCENVEELRKREGEWIRKSNCVNRYIAGRTKKEADIDNQQDRKEKGKEYYKKNAEVIKARVKKWAKENPEKVKARTKAYNAAHKVEKAIKDKAYREANKERLQAKNRIKVKCPCGMTVVKCAIKRHERTERHQNFLKGIEYTPKHRKDRIKCECGLEYNRANKIRHMKAKTHIAMINKTHYCVKCDTAFQYKKHLDIHMKICPNTSETVTQTK